MFAQYHSGVKWSSDCCAAGIRPISDDARESIAPVIVRVSARRSDLWQFGVTTSSSEGPARGLGVEPQTTDFGQLRGAKHLHDWQVSPSVVILDFEVEAIARHSGYEGRQGRAWQVQPGVGQQLATRPTDAPVTRGVLRLAMSGPEENRTTRANVEETSLGIAVGTAVASRPPHRCVREVLPHTAPP